MKDIDKLVIKDWMVFNPHNGNVRSKPTLVYSPKGDYETVINLSGDPLLAHSAANHIMEAAAKLNTTPKDILKRLSSGETIKWS